MPQRSERLCQSVLQKLGFVRSRKTLTCSFIVEQMIITVGFGIRTIPWKTNTYSETLGEAKLSLSLTHLPFLFQYVPECFEDKYRISAGLKRNISCMITRHSSNIARPKLSSHNHPWPVSHRFVYNIWIGHYRQADSNQFHRTELPSHAQCCRCYQWLGNNGNSGHVRVLQFDGTNWIARGDAIEGDAANDW